MNRATTRLPASSFSLRVGQRRDSDAVLSIFFAALVEHGFSAIKANVNAEIARFGTREDKAQDDFVAVRARKVCGFAILQPRGDGEGELSKVFVAKSHRGSGVGTMLIERCAERAVRRGYRRLFLETHHRFAVARQYYARHGWKPGPDPTPAEPEIYTYTLDLVGCAPRLVIVPRR